MTRRSVHYLAREHGFLTPLVGLAANVLVLACVLVQLRAMTTTVRLTLATAGSIPAAAVAKSAIVKVLSENRLSLDSEEVPSVEDLRFRLAARAGASHRAVVRILPSVRAEVLARVLHECARAGFTDVAVQTEPEL